MVYLLRPWLTGFVPHCLVCPERVAGIPFPVLDLFIFFYYIFILRFLGVFLFGWLKAIPKLQQNPILIPGPTAVGCGISFPRRKVPPFWCLYWVPRFSDPFILVLGVIGDFG